MSEKTLKAFAKYVCKRFDSQEARIAYIIGIFESIGLQEGAN
jgi:hypothetical protein